MSGGAGEGVRLASQRRDRFRREAPGMPGELSPRIALDKRLRS
jgi:hypothetical protein